MAADSGRSGWRRGARRPAVIAVTAVVVAVLIGGATAWAVGGSGASGYVTTTAVTASLASRLDVIGTVEPVSDASASFQVSGKVTSVNVAAGDQVTPGETLASLDPTALTQSVESAQSTLESDEAKLTEDEDGETSGTGDTAGTGNTTGTGNTGAGASTAARTSGTPATATLMAYTAPSGSGSSNAQITQDQAKLVADQHQESLDQQKEAADLTQAETVCGTNTNPPTPPASASSCATALATVSTDEEQVANDQQTVATDENNLATALAAAQSSLPTTGSGTTGTTTPTGSNTKSSGSGTGFSGSSGSGSGGSASSSASTDSAQQIASDQAAIDAAEANLIEAQQALNEAQLTSPIAGTVASVGIGVGDTVTADSSTSVIVIIGTHSFEVAGTLTSSQVTSVKVGNTAGVAVDGTTGTITGTVAQVGPVQSSSSGYSYPVVVDLPTSVTGLYPGSTAAMAITTASASHVLAVPTSAVTTEGTRTYVTEMSAGDPVRKVVKVGIVGGIYTQVLSGLKKGDSVVLANLSEPVPASSTTTVGGFGGEGAGGFTGGGGGGFTGGGGARFSGAGGFG